MARLIFSGLTVSAALAGASAAEAQDAVDNGFSIEAAYTADLIGVVSGGASRSGYLLDNLDLVADADLEAMYALNGVRAHAHVLNNSGAAPNDVAGTLQGVDNIEVASHRLRLFEAWLEKDWGAASVRAGLYDVNSEFYANESAGLLIAPAFGIGSELAATGPNGPSIFPSTALGVRFNMQIGENYYARAAALNAHAGVIGDPDGVDTDFDGGALVLAEAGFEGDSKIAFGAWRYSDKQDDVVDVDAAGDPRQRVAQGAYILIEAPITKSDAGRAMIGFLRAGVSDGATTPFKGGWQAGVLVERAWPGRPESAFSLGVNQGLLSDGFRRGESASGGAMDKHEMQFEITYSDRLGPHVSIQPDLQYSPNPGGDRDADAVVTGGLRVTLTL